MIDGLNNTVYWLSNLRAIRFPVDRVTHTLRLVVKVWLSQEANSRWIDLLDELYIPTRSRHSDDGDYVVVRGLDKVLAQRVGSGTLVQVITEQIREGNPTLSLSNVLMVLGGRWHHSQPANEWCKHNFLQGIEGWKVTDITMPEWLYYYGEAASVRVDATYYTEDGAMQQRTWELEPSNVTRAMWLSGGYGAAVEHLWMEENDYQPIHRIDVSPAQFAVDGWLLGTYRVTCAFRSAEFALDNVSRPGGLKVVFFNGYGVPDTARIWGSISKEVTAERIIGRVAGAERAISIEPTSTFTAYSGVITDAVAGWWEDLLLSRGVWLIDKQAHELKGTPIVITDHKFVRSSDADELPVCEIKYRPSDSYERMELKEIAAGVFDYTFDDSYA